MAQEPRAENPLDAIRSYYQDSDRELGRRALRDQHPEFDKAYFDAAIDHRFSVYPEQPGIVDFEAAAGKRVLEVGVGHGLDHLMFARAGARVHGVDLTPKHCEITRRALELNGFTPRVTEADATDLPFADGTFDIVYSCGVFLLTDDIHAAIAETYRVLAPGGVAIVMLYNGRSVHHWIKTRFYYGFAFGEDRYLGRDVTDDWYTDGPGYVSVHHYAPSDLSSLFGRFETVQYRLDCLSPEQIPLFGLPRLARVRRWLRRRFGFYMWIKAWR